MKKAIEVLLVVGISLLSCGGGFAESPEKEITWKKDNSIMVLIPAGEFTMGSSSGNDNEKPPHKVHLDAYYIDKYEVTNEQFAKFLNEWGRDTNEYGKKMFYEHPWGIKVAASRFVVGTEGYEKHPAFFVTWYGANQYAKWAGKRLPTEAEWEKACRAGTTTKYYSGNDTTTLGNYVWYSINSGGKTHPMGEKKSNAWSIYDMAGNVGEWCSDWYKEDYYKSSPSKNPAGPNSGNHRVFRGGGWGLSAEFYRSAYRYRFAPDFRYGFVGFRCAVSASEVGKKK